MSDSFCPNCGSRLAHEPPVTCDGCGAQLWRNPKPAAAALIANEGQLLLARRAHSPWRDRWCAPSGFCEWAEHPIVTARREAMEETGIDVEITGYLGTWMSAYAEDDRPGEDRGDSPSIAVSYYFAVPVGEKTTSVDPAEVAEASWFPIDILPTELAPPTAFRLVLGAWRAAYEAGKTVTPLPDRPA